MTFLTKAQSRALNLLNEHCAAALDFRSTKSVKLVDGKWEYEYYDYEYATWELPGTAKITYKFGESQSVKDSYYSKPLTIAWSVAGELQNKELAKVRIDIRNRTLYLELTELGKVTASLAALKK